MRDVDKEARRQAYLTQFISGLMDAPATTPMMGVRPSLTIRDTEQERRRMCMSFSWCGRLIRTLSRDSVCANNSVLHFSRHLSH